MGFKLLPFSPERYHGKQNSRPYFEGWYFKQAFEQAAFSVIPGIYRGIEWHSDIAFIQLIFSNPSHSLFIRYPEDAFVCHPRKFELRIAESFFSMDKVRLDIKQIDTKAELRYSGHIKLRKSLFCPSVMGPFAYLPGMQCNHGVLSLSHKVNGYVNGCGRSFSFKDACGYIEKDWGSAFPESWMWMQCQDADASLMCAVASIPLGPFSFTGLICILRLKEKEYRFATYNGASVKAIKQNDYSITVKLQCGVKMLNITTETEKFGSLKAPAKTGMERIIKESINAAYYIELKNGTQRIFSGHFENGGLEMHGMEKLKKVRVIINN